MIMNEMRAKMATVQFKINTTESFNSSKEH